jgi:hypothetical protein
MSITNEAVEKTMDSHMNLQVTQLPRADSRSDSTAVQRCRPRPHWAWSNGHFDWMDWHAPFAVTE